MQNGDILTLVRQYTDVDFGGDLLTIDGTQLRGEHPAAARLPGLPGPAQTAATLNPVSTIPGPSPGGRFNSAYPLWDGTGASSSAGPSAGCSTPPPTPPTIVPCTSDGLAAANAQVALPLYSVWMLDPAQNTMLPVMAPVEGVMVTDVAVAQPRPLPNIILDQVPGVDLNQDFASACRRD